MSDLPTNSARVQDAYRVVSAIDSEAAVLSGREHVALLVRVQDTLVARLDGEEDEQEPQPAAAQRRK